MSISKGGQSVKPYVGSKEVKEAYVGSQLVYRAIPPYYYYFMGTPNDYILNKIELVTNSAVTKTGGYENYVLKMTTTKSGAIGTGAQIRLNVSEHKGKVLHLKAFAQARSVTYQQKTNPQGSVLKNGSFNFGSSPTLTELTIDNQANYIDIYVTYNYTGEFCAFNEIWVEQE